VRLVGCCLLAACWSSSPTAPVAPVQSPGVIVDAPAGTPVVIRRDRRGIPRHSVWEGTYVCNQGLSAVRLTLDVDRTNNVVARYDFGPVPSNPTVPAGAYLLTGALVPQGGNAFTGALVDSEWIVRPPGYFMVPLSIDTGDGKSMTGAIEHPTCSGFQATRIE
jgi:hypothetical protein